MSKVMKYIRKNPLSIMLLALPMSVVAQSASCSPIWVFTFSALAVIPMAGYIGSSTETLAQYTGPRIGGLLNATFGNAAELIITMVAIKAGLLELVKASITGSILGNLLLVMGMAMLLGGIRHGTQKFDRKQAGTHATLFTLAILALVVPSIFSHYIGQEGSIQVEILSLGVAIVMIVLYILGLVYSLRTASGPLGYSATPDHNKMSLWMAIGILALSTIGIVISSEFLVGAVEGVVDQIGLSEFFLGIILIPLIGNVAEHLVAVQVAIRNKMDLSVEIAVSSSLQIALFVAPLLVFISLLLGHPLTLIFNQFELIALGGAAIIVALVSLDGESNWLEGGALIGVYIILGISFFLLHTIK
jgi:Ca2+:H+ antiporter